MFRTASRLGTYHHLRCSDWRTRLWVEVRGRAKGENAMNNEDEHGLVYWGRARRWGKENWNVSYEKVAKVERWRCGSCFREEVVRKLFGQRVRGMKTLRDQLSLIKIKAAIRSQSAAVRCANASMRHVAIF
eukprot:6172065-Pleurochrysis_carterae.AAC.6